MSTVHNLNRNLVFPITEGLINRSLWSTLTHLPINKIGYLNGGTPWGRSPAS